MPAKTSRALTKSPKLPASASAIAGGKFTQFATPIVVEPDKATLALFRCPDCKNPHFRHAGFLEAHIPFVKADMQEHMANNSLAVKVCTKCKKCYVWEGSQIYDVTKLIDLKAWGETEKEMQEATGPGGQC